MARLRSAPTSQTFAPTTQARQPLKDRTNTSRKKAPIYENDGNTEDLVKDAPGNKRRTKKAAQNEDDFVMAGGLGQQGSDDIEDEIVVARSERPVPSDDLAKTSKSAPAPAKTNRRPPRATRKPLQTEAQSEVLEDVKRRMQATARKEANSKSTDAHKAPATTAPSSDSLAGRTKAKRRSNNSAAERSEFSLSPSPPPPGQLSSVKRLSLAQPGSALRQQSTPTAAETSILALKDFKRRPRQPSMLQMVQQRTASARPSAVNLQGSEDPNVFDLDVAGDDDDFAPEAEGTPLHASKQPVGVVTRTSNQKAKTSTGFAPKATISRKRRSDEVEQPSSLDLLKAKRQKSEGPAMLEELQATSRKGMPAQRSSSERQRTPLPAMTSDIQVINSSPSSTPPTEPSSADRRPTSPILDDAIPSTEKQQDDLQYVPQNDLEDDNGNQDVPNGTMAEPASSSPLPSVPLVAPTQKRDLMADPLTQVSPPRPKQREKTKKKARPFNTATLQALLPKRRQPQKPRHRKSEYDIDTDSDEDSPLDTSHLEEDEDELSGTARRRTKSAAPSKSRKSTAAKKSQTRQRKAATSTRKSTVPSARKSSAPPTKKKASKKTYGRNTTSDKENDDANYDSPGENENSVLPDTSISMHDAAQSKELEEAKKKFAELDDWEMEFESMSVEEGRSSSQAWR